MLMSQTLTRDDGTALVKNDPWLEPYTGALRDRYAYYKSALEKVEENGGLVQLFGDMDGFAFDAYFVYPEELKSVARIQVFRDFLVAKAQQWEF